MKVNNKSTSNLKKTEYLNVNKFTLGPMNLSAKYEVMKTDDRRTPNPSTEASSQLRCFEDLLKKS